MPADAPLVSFKNVSKRYPGGGDALAHITLDIAPGEMVVITGPSGAGKTTLLKMLPVLERPTSGKIAVAGENITAIRARAIPYLRRRLGLVFQDQKLLYDRSVFENVLLPLAASGHPPAEAARRVRAALDKVGLLARERANPIALSGGEQQRVAIARAVVNRPTLLIADEPTSNLDAEYATRIGEIFRSFNQVGVTVMVATHDTVFAERFASRRLHLASGRIEADTGHAQ